MVVRARPARMSAASVSAPIAAGWPDALTKRMHASTLGPGPGRPPGSKPGLRHLVMTGISAKATARSP